MANPVKSQREPLSPAARRFYNLPKAVKYQPLVPDLIRYNAQARERYARAATVQAAAAAYVDPTGALQASGLLVVVGVAS